MRLPRDLSGEEVVRLLSRHFEYEIVRTRGSHIIVRRETPDSPPHILTVPRHRNVSIGTLDSIVGAVAESLSLPKNEVRELLFE